MIIACDHCHVQFEYRGGRAHFARREKHYCGNKCLSESNVVHGMNRRDKSKRDHRYSLFHGAKKRAKQNGVIFNLKPEDIPLIPEICPILGILIQKNDKAGPIDSSPSLDRIIPKLGYVQENIRIISNRANRLRSDGLTHEFLLIHLDSLKIDNGNTNDS